MLSDEPMVPGRGRASWSTSRWVKAKMSLPEKMEGSDGT